MASNCASKIDLYINEEISRLNQIYTSTVYAGTGHQEGVHYMVDIPVMTLMAASNTSYGDAFILQYSAQYPIQICVTDNTTTYYPFPAQTGIGGCTLFYNLNAASEEQVVIQYQNYMNRAMMGTSSTTRVYFTAWSDYVDTTNATMGAGFDVNFTIMPTSRISQAMTINWFW